MRGVLALCEMITCGKSMDVLGHEILRLPIFYHYIFLRFQVICVGDFA